MLVERHVVVVCVRLISSHTRETTPKLRYQSRVAVVRMQQHCPTGISITDTIRQARVVRFVAIVLHIMRIC